MSERDRILDSIAGVVNSALDEAGIYDVDSVGWATEYEPDPEYYGHAMWQLDRPQFDLDELAGERSVSKRPKEKEKLIATLGSDFCDLMQASRLSIGLALLWYPQANNDLFDHGSFFWLHHSDAILRLAIASDRIRSLLIVACTGNPPETYQKECKKKRRYVTPFNQAGHLLVARGLIDPQLVEHAQALPAIGDAIYEFIRQRNAIVHEVATPMARIIENGFSKLQERFDQEAKTGSVQGVDSLGYSDHECESKPWKEVDEAVNEMQSWYKLLLRASHQVFVLEYWSRACSQQED